MITQSWNADIAFILNVFRDGFNMALDAHYAAGNTVKTRKKPKRKVKRKTKNKKIKKRKARKRKTRKRKS